MAPVVQAQTTLEAGDEGCLQIEELLDVKAMPERRQIQLKLAERDMQNGNWHTAYVLGSLYRLGDRHPSKLVPQDFERAKALLSQAAIHGEIPAMAAMAEVYLAQNRAMDAMVWAQAFAYFDGKYPKKNDRDHQAYPAYLIQRSFAALGQDAETMQMVNAYLNAFIAKYSETIEVGQQQERDGAKGRQPGSECRLDENAKQWPLYGVRPKINVLAPPRVYGHALSAPGIALYLVKVDPDGSVQQATVVDSLPDMTAAKGLYRIARSFRFNAVAADAPARYAYLPMNYDDGRMSLRPAAD